MYCKRTIEDKYQLSLVRNGTTKEIVNKADLDTTTEMLTKTITDLFLQGKVLNIAVISEDGNISKIEMNSFTPSNF